jgi:bacterioferritin (cytochrome b1)
MAIPFIKLPYSKPPSANLESSAKEKDIGEKPMETEDKLENDFSHGVDSKNKSIEKQPVSLYRHTVSDICVLVDPFTKKMVPKQSSIAIEYMLKNHHQDSIQSLIDQKILLELGGNPRIQALNLSSNDKTSPKHVAKSQIELESVCENKKEMEKIQTNKKDNVKKTILDNQTKLKDPLKSEHIPYWVMVLAAVKALKESKGSSLVAIKKYIEVWYKV